MNPKLMGVVNVTPDSFSDGGLYLDEEKAIAHGRELVQAGADILDVGGESTRPGAEQVSAEEEIARTEPVVAELTVDIAQSGHEVSIDTSKLAVAEAALDAGATIVNDVTALRGDPEIGPLCADRDAGLILMHMQGDPRTMQESPTYDEVVDDVRAFLAERLEAALAAGVAEERIWLDPGIGFGKNLDHNLELLRRIGELRRALGRPLVVGASRKSFIGADRRIRGRWPARRHDRRLDPRRRRGGRRPPRPRCRRGRAGGQGRQRRSSDRFRGDRAAGRQRDRGAGRGRPARALDLHPPWRHRCRAGDRPAARVRRLLRRPRLRRLLTDRLEDTIDYSEVCDIVALAATERSYRTLERLAQVVGERLMERYRCESVRVRAAKPEPPLPLAIQEVAVEVTQERTEEESEENGEEA